MQSEHYNSVTLRVFHPARRTCLDRIVAMVVRLCPKLSRKKLLLLLPVVLLMMFMLKTSTNSLYICQEQKDKDNESAALSRKHLTHSLETDSWGNAILLGGRPRQEKGVLTIGIPTVRRQNGSYLMSTLGSLINGSTETDRQNTTIVISINDQDLSYSFELMGQLRAAFAVHLHSGFIIVITAPRTYYPSLTSLKTTFGDSEHRVRWRSKQNLDYAFLLHYCQNFSKYYLQLEDDVIAAPGYIGKMTSYISLQSNRWTMLDFSEMGFIGKLYRSSDIHKLAILLRVFFNEQPCDFLLLHFLNLMLQKKRYIRIPTLFRHVGYYSSLRNTTRDSPTKGLYFEGLTKNFKGDNPPAKLHTTIEHYENNVIENAYAILESGGVFWGKTPKAGDSITILFDKPHNITRIVIATGHSSDKEKDRIHGAVLKYGRTIGGKAQSPSCNENIFVGNIDNAEFDYNEKRLINVKCLTIDITENHTEWLFLKEIAIFVK